MNPPPALLSSSQHPPLVVSSPFHFRPASLSRRRRLKVLLPRHSSDRSLSSTADTSAVFGSRKDLTGIQPVIENFSPSFRLATSAVLLAGAIAAGYSLGLRFGRTRNAALGGGALLGAAGGAVIHAVNSVVPEIAAVRLHNYVAGCDAPGAVNKEDIENIAKKYGVSKQDEAFNMELCDLYCCYVSYVLPSPSEHLKGDEADKIIGFKNALGIDDPDAAAMHMEIGRRIFRQRLETGCRGGDEEQRRAFQRLVYVSTLVFGEASSFLLPWKRVFKVTDAQVEIAIRENSKHLYASMLSVDRDVNPKQLIALREAQLKYRLPDEIAEDLFREHTRKLVEENISAALSILKSGRSAVGGFKKAVGELDRILAFNSLLISLRDNRDADLFARGVGPVSLVGGEYDSEKQTDDLKLLYRAYFSDSLAGGCMEDNKLAALSQLRNVLGLGKREAEAIALDLTSKVYQKRLFEAVQDGKLEMADSKAAFLQNLCDELHFDMEKARNIHDDMYREKLQQCVADGELDDEDVSALLRLRVMLCIPQQTVDAAHEEICGSLYEKVVIDAISAGNERFGDDVRKVVKKAAHGLRLTREVAMSITSKAVRKIFLFHIKLAQSSKNSMESVIELEKMIAFNSLVVTKLVADIKGEVSDSPSEENVKIEAPKLDQEDGCEELPARKKIRPLEELPVQTEITLKEDISEKDRIDLYWRYLTYCCNNEVKTFPAPTPLVRDKELKLKRLQSILGLTDNEMNVFHQSVAKKAFRKQAEVLLADGQLTEARIDQLSELQKKVGLPPEYTLKIIKSITGRNKIPAATGQGKLDINQIRELKESGVNLDSILAGRSREKVLKKIVNEIFSSGTGEIDEEEFDEISSALDINAEEAKGVVHDVARSRLKYSLIEAVSQLRQRNDQGVVSSLNDLLVCDKVVPSEGLSWDVPVELADLFGIYARSNPEPQKLARLQYLLGISDSRAAALRDGNGMLFVREEEENFVF